MGKYIDIFVKKIKEDCDSEELLEKISEEDDCFHEVLEFKRIVNEIIQEMMNNE